MPMPDLLNASVNQTLSRSVITHVTVSLALLALLLFGGQAIHSFTATMMFGVVLVGTYTSVFIASPILIYLGVGTGRDSLTAPAKTKTSGLSMAGAAFTAMRRICRDRRRSMPMARAASASRGMSHRGSLLCLPDGIWAWPVTTVGESTKRRLAPVLERADALDFFLLGVGAAPWALPERLRLRFREAGISLDAMPTGPAVSTYNILLGENRRVGAGLIAV